jgi:hypothetical protein
MTEIRRTYESKTYHATGFSLWWVECYAHDDYIGTSGQCERRDVAEHVVFGPYRTESGATRRRKKFEDANS